jgi:hypothetical protein
MEQMPYHVYVLGIGMRGMLHLTPETAQAISRCTTVFLLHPDASVRDGLRHLGPAVVDVSDEYGEGQSRVEVYRRIAALVLDAATTNPPVALVTYGHPLFIVRSSEVLLEEAPARGLRVRAYPALSSLDALIVDLRIDVAAGLQMFDANRLLTYRPTINPFLAVLIWQPATVGTLLATARRSRPERYRPLQEVLLQVFPAEHPVVAALVSTHPLLGQEIHRTTLGSLLDLATFLDERPTLYLPAVESHPRDEEFARSLLDPSSLERIVSAE